MSKTKLTLEQFIQRLTASLEGEITAGWYKLCQETDLELGEADDDNVGFLIYSAGVCRGADFANDMWYKQLEIKGLIDELKQEKE